MRDSEESGIRNQESGIGIPVKMLESGIRNQESGIRNRNPGQNGGRSNKSGTRNQESNGASRIRRETGESGGGSRIRNWLWLP